MTLEEVKKFIEENKDNEEVKNYVAGFVTSDRVENFLNTDDGKKVLQPKLDQYFNKGLETWKKNNLDKLVDDKVKELYPDETPEQKELKKLRQEIEQAKQEREKERLRNVALTTADGKIPKDLVGYLLGEDEETTTANIQKVAELFENHVSSKVEEKFKQNSREPHKGGGGENEITKEEFMKMGYQDRVKIATESPELYKKLKE